MKELKIPFTFYDFFGYFLPGLITVLAIILLYVPSHDVKILKAMVEAVSKMGIVSGVSSILLCYVLGHFMTSLSSWILEKIILHKLLPNILPENRLIFTKGQKGLFSTEFTGKFRTIWERYFNNEIDKVDKSEIFWLCNSVVVDECPNIYSRVFVFLSFYGFARTMSLIFGLSAIGFAVRLLANRFEVSSLLLLIGSVISCAVFSYEYLRFLKYHRREVFYGFYIHIADKYLTIKKQ